MKPLIQQLLFCTIILCLFSCKKDKSSATPKTARELIQNSWRIMELYVVGEGLNGENKVDSYEPCEKDNFVTLIETGKCVTNFGELKCGTEAQTDSSLTWELVTDKKLKISGFMHVTEYDIAELSESTLLITTPTVTGPTGTVYYKYIRL